MIFKTMSFFAGLVLMASSALADAVHHLSVGESVTLSPFERTTVTCSDRGGPNPPPAWESRTFGVDVQCFVQRKRQVAGNNFITAYQAVQLMEECRTRMPRWGCEEQGRSSDEVCFRQGWIAVVGRTRSLTPQESSMLSGACTVIRARCRNR